MKRDALREYLAQSYQCDVLGKGTVRMPECTPELMEAAKTAMARIDRLRLGPSLAGRDYVSYQHRKALLKLLATESPRLNPVPGEGVPHAAADESS